MSRRERMEAVLREHLAPTALVITDESARHEGHAGIVPEAETHFHIALTSPAFSGKSRVDRHRLVQQLLHAEFGRGLHALSLALASPDDKTT